MPLPRLPDATVQRDPAVGRSNVVAVPQVEICKHLLQLVLRYLAGSALQGGPVRQGPATRKADRGWVKVDRHRLARRKDLRGLWLLRQRLGAHRAG